MAFARFGGMLTLLPAKPFFITRKQVTPMISMTSMTSMLPMLPMSPLRRMLMALVASAAVFHAAGMAQTAAPAQTLTVAAFPALDQIIKAALPAFKKLHPEVEVKVIGREYADHHNAMTLALATGSNQADVMALELGYLGRFAEGGALEDLARPPYNARQLAGRFVAFALAPANSSRQELVALPTDIGPGTLFYRQDLLKKAGVAEADWTKSWESYIEGGKKIKAATGSYLLAHARDLNDIMIRSNLKPGEGIYFDKANKVLVDSPRFVNAFKLAKAVREAKLDAKINAWTNEWTESFKRGTVATQMMGAWLDGHLANNFALASKGLWRAADLPGGAFASWGGSYYAIPKKAKNKAMAWELIQFLTLSRGNQLAAFKAQDAFPALLDAQNDAFFEQGVDYFGQQKVRLLWRAAAQHIPPIDVNKYDPIAGEIVNHELDKVLDQGKDIQAALQDAKHLIEKRAQR
jgi:multiple sugar transport system substrate-binding protein